MSVCIFTGLEVVESRANQMDAKLFKVRLGEEELEYAVMNDVITTYNREEEDKWKLLEPDKLKLMQSVLSSTDSGIMPVFVWDKKQFAEIAGVRALEIEEIRKTEIDHKYKEDEILKLLSTKVRNSSPFSRIGFHLFDLYRLKMFDAKELYRWLKSLEDKGLIKFLIPLPTLEDRGNRYPIGLDQYRSNLLQPGLIEITPRGWEKLYDDSRSDVTRNVFIAMAFTDNSGAVLPGETRETIKNACKSLGWNPLIVDEVGHNDGVMDKIISLINESRFVVADLTHHKLGVYYEAGYAKSKGLEVIHAVHESDMSKCHFDVKHLNLIIYNDQVDLSEKLKNRIGATVGPFVETDNKK